MNHIPHYIMEGGGMSIDLRFFLRKHRIMGQKIRRSPQIPLCGVALNVLIGFTQPVEKLEFGGESPLTMRYGLRVDNPHPLGPSTGTA